MGVRVWMKRTEWERRVVCEIVRERRRVVSGSRIRALREGVEVRVWRWAVAMASGSIAERKMAVLLR